MAQAVVNFEMGPTQGRFCNSERLENCLVGPRGEGKTSAGIMAMVAHAKRHDAKVRPIPWAILRDTWTNLERTTLESFLNPREGSFESLIQPHLRIRDGGRVIELPGYFKAYLFGMDSLSDLNRLQSLQLGGLWLEEPAPAAAEDIGGGLEERVLTVGITSLRHPCSPRTQITMNYPDEDHWTWRRYHQSPGPSKALFRIPSGENSAITQEYRDNMRMALADDLGLLQRLVLGEPGFVCQGEQVTPEYNSGVHQATVALEPIPNLPGYRFWDGWHNPVCVVGQLTARGVFQVYETLMGPGMAVKQLIDTQVRPAIRDRYYMIPVWQDWGDPSMATPDQGDIENCAAWVVERELRTVFNPGPMRWDIRKQALKEALNYKVDGEWPFLQLSATETKLHKALRGGWHYRKDSSGRIIGRTPVKDGNSHPGDALSYGIGEVMRLSKNHLIDIYQDRFDDEDDYHRDYRAVQKTGRSAVTGY